MLSFLVITGLIKILIGLVLVGFGIWLVGCIAQSACSKSKGGWGFGSLLVVLVCVLVGLGFGGVYRLKKSSPLPPESEAHPFEWENISLPFEKEVVDKDLPKGPSTTKKDEVPPKAPKKPKSKKVEVFSQNDVVMTFDQVKGLPFKSKEDAYQDALNKARDQVEEYLARQGLQGTVRTEDVEKLVQETETVPYPNPRHDPQMENMMSVELQLTMRHEDLKEFKQADRHVRAQTRVELLSKILAGVVVLLLTIGTYIRLDEFSKGYYRIGLRAGAAATVAAAFAGLVFFTF